MNYSQCMNRGFSLVELSIVLVILGLLTGGILAGQSLIRAAEIRSTIAGFRQYTAAVYSFRDKYFSFPGDMTNATKFWGVRVAGTDLACHQTISVMTGTCNGDGNGQIIAISGDSTGGENFLTWQHMAYAGLVEGSYTGASDNASSLVRTPGVNSPRSRISNGRYAIGWVGPQNGDLNYFDGSYSRNMLSVGGANAAFLRPEEMWNIDTKMDDGKPGLGRAFGFKSTSSYALGCTTSDLATTAEYALSNQSLICNGISIALF